MYNLGMLTSLVAAATLAPGAISPALRGFVGDLAGNYTIARGVYQSGGTLGNSPQNIIVKVNNVNTPYNNVYMLGDPMGSNYFGSGNACIVVLANSAPLKATYSALTMTAQMAKYGNVGAQRSVPMSAGGVLYYGVAMCYETKMQFLTPGFSLGGFDFPNGCVITLNTFPASFSVPLPSQAVNSSANVWPPSGNAAPYEFRFTATGPKTTMSITGGGNTRPLTVQGSLTGTSTTFDHAELEITAVL